MASPPGRGAQERLTGDDQTLARGANGRRLIDNIRDKAVIEAEAAAAGVAMLDEVLTPGGLLPGFAPGGEPGVSLSAVNTLVDAAIAAEAQNRINAINQETQSRTAAIAAEAAVRIAAITAAVAALQSYTDGKIAALPTGGGTTPTTPTTPVSPNPDPPPVTSIADRLNAPIRTRNGAYLEFRIPVVVTEPDPGQTTPTLPAGSIVGRNGAAITDRSAVIIQFRTVPDGAVVVPVDPDPEPPATDPVYPSGPHLRLEAPHGNVVIESQDGVSAVIRLVRPIYWLDRLFNVSHFNTSLGNVNTFYTYKGPGDLLGIIGGEPALTRDITSLDDGTFTTEVLEGMSDGSFLQLALTIKIAPNRTGVVPAPSAIPAKDSVVFLEDFAPNTGTGALNRSFGNVTNTGNGSVLLLGRASAMTQTDPANRISNDYGFPNGRYEYDVRFIGDLGNAGGPALVLWPASDGWPGPEVDLGEFFADGKMYMALHWKDATKPVENNGQNQATIWPMPQGFNPYVRNILAADLLTDKCIFYVNGVEFARDDFSPPPKDFAHGGENHTLGLLSGSDQSSDGGPTGLECWRIKFTPEALMASEPKLSLT